MCYVNIFDTLLDRFSVSNVTGNEDRFKQL